MKKLFSVIRTAVSTFWGAIKSGLRKYVKFKGRATRTEYWCFILFLYLLALIPATFILLDIEDAQSAYQATSNLMSDIQGPYVETTKEIPIDSLASDNPISKAVESSVETAKEMSLPFLAIFSLSSVTAIFILGLILFAIFRLIIPLLSLSVMVRRLHDTGRSGWACLIGLVPFIGGLILFVWLCKGSNLGENKYGENPKGL
jgi:uncharacterized membrane protein YhaH (DUF805 family)